MHLNIDAFLNAAPEGDFGVAVSGGGDSIGLLMLCADWAKRTGRTIHAITIDHQLRDDSAKEAAFVADFCKSFGVSHAVVAWQGWDGVGNLQNAARFARIELISQWAQGRGIRAILSGHTLDDQAETFLMRLARGSGVDGLSAMSPRVHKNGLTWMRPLLETSRDDLRRYLRSKNQNWVEDPSNDDRRFDRVKARQALPILAELGLTTQRLVKTASRMQTAREALELASEDFANNCAQANSNGVVSFERTAFFKSPVELRQRVLAQAFSWVSGDIYRPRLAALTATLQAAQAQTDSVLGGCLIANTGARFEVVREPAAMPVSCLRQGETEFLYDGRWRLTGPPCVHDVIVKPLGETGILLRPKWRETAHSRKVILSSPSIWYNNELMSVPLLDNNGPWKCVLARGPDRFFRLT